MSAHSVLKVKLSYDDTPLDPREDDGDRRMDFLLLADGVEDAIYAEAERVLTATQFQKFKDIYQTSNRKVKAAELQKFLLKTGKFLSYNVYRYSHSGVVYKVADVNPFACPFDSGLCGWIVISKAAACEHYGVKNITKDVADKIREYAESQIDVYGLYRNGEVFCLQWKVVNTQNEELEDVECCGGFFGYDVKTNGMLDYIPEPFKTKFESQFMSFTTGEWNTITASE